MFWNLFRRNIDEKQFEGIEKALYFVAKPNLDKNRKDLMRSHILNSIKNKNFALIPSSLAILGEKIREAAFPVHISAYLKALVKEKVMLYIGRNAKFAWFFRTRFIFQRAVSVALVVAIAITGVFSFMDKPEIVSAKPVTVLRDISGNIAIVRDDKEILPQNNFALLQNDIIETRDGTATIKYFDNSISRLNKNTKIKISKLISDNSGINTEVELDFNNGQMWNMVFDLLGDSLFKVHIDKLTASVVDRATFSLLAENNKAELNVFSNIVDFSVGSNGKIEKKAVLKGYKAVARIGLLKAKPRINIVAKNVLNPDQKEWVEGNLKKDKEYIARILQEQASSQKTALKNANELKEDPALYMSFSDEEKLRLKLNIAESKFSAGQALINEGKIDEARVNISYIQKVISDAKTRIDELKNTNPDEAKKLEEMINEKLLKYKKELELVTPDLPLYEAKQAVRDMELVVADSDTKKAQILLSNISSILFETQNLVDNKKYEDAKSNLAESQNLITELKSMEASKNPEIIAEVANKNADIIKMLTLIENTSNSDELNKEVNTIKNSSIQSIIETAAQGDKETKEIVAPAVKEVDNFIKTYDKLGPAETDAEEGQDEVSPKIKLFYDRNTDSGASDSSVQTQN